MLIVSSEKTELKFREAVQSFAIICVFAKSQITFGYHKASIWTSVRPKDNTYTSF